MLPPPPSEVFLSFFSWTIKHQHLTFSVAVRLSLAQFSDGQLPWLRDMTLQLQKDTKKHEDRNGEEA